MTLSAATAVTRSAVGREGGYASPFGRTTTCMMFDQRELSLPVERTFQYQRPGSEQQRCADDAHVHRLHLRAEAAVARDPQVVALGALGLVPAERDLRRADDGARQRARPAWDRAGASPRRRDAAASDASAQPRDTSRRMRGRVEESAPIPLHIDSDMRRTLPRAGGRGSWQP